MALKISLMPHQSKAIDELKSGSILCGGVGSGKSMTSLAYYFFDICRGVLWNNCILGPLLEPRPLYIITTARKRDTGEWVDEMKRFGLQEGGENAVEYVIDSWNNLHKYDRVENAFFIFDEQRLVSSTGKWVKSFYKIARKNKWILLSATPGDRWEDYIAVFVANGFYRNKSDFMFQHAIYNPYITKFPKIDGWKNEGLLMKHRRDITVIMKYEKKTERHWQKIVTGYDTVKYDTVFKKRWDPWKDEPIRDISNCCYLLRKVCNYSAERAKEVVWITLNSATQKSIVFYNYDYELDILKEEIEDVKEFLMNESYALRNSGSLEIAEWNGHKHEPIPKSSCWIYLVQYAAGAEGWNCTETDTVIFFSQSYSYKLTEQAAGRIDRLNTQFTDLYYYVMTTDSLIDRAITRALDCKKTFNEKKFWAHDVEKELVEENIRKRKKFIEYEPEVEIKCPGGSYKMCSKDRFTECEDAYNQISVWEERYGCDILKAVVKTWRGDRVTNIEEVVG